MSPAPAPLDVVGDVCPLFGPREEISMKRIACLVSALSLTALVMTGCATGRDDGTESSEAALTSLTAQQCQAPNVASVPKTDSAGRPIDGTAKTTLTGCIVGKANETGADVISRATALLGDTAKFGGMTDDTGKPLFSKFTARAPSGTLAAGLVQEIDVELNADYSPAGRIRVTRRANSDGSYSLAISNVSAFKATFLIFPVEAIRPGNLSLNVTLKPETNGISVNGKTEVQLEQQPEQAAEASQLGTDMFTWLTEELAR
jgi:hypothetical protein